MFCLAGTALYRDFEMAIEKRADARDELLRAPKDSDENEDTLFTAKQSFSDALVAWVAHRSGCVECRAISLPHDLEQFASV